jgi:hypothetical protein
MAVTQNQVLETLSYLLGENSVPTSSVADSRRNFIQKTVEEVYRAYPWVFAGTTATLSIVDGVATLPSNFDSQQKIYAYFYSGDQQTALTEINIGDSDMYTDGQYRYWVEYEDGAYVIKTKDTNYDTAVTKYQSSPPQLSATVTTPFNDAMTLALGARRYVKLGQNPDADISQDEALFQKRLNENIAAAQVNRPLKKHRKIYYANNYRMGEG